ncbi:histidine kinase [Nocardioides KLBMP 9356]|uniref:histidine kinase n=1 Tax=Nocardioides potassii TaxID=2911371 RepID=A0ABS9H7B0_9ACTN|nr:histidine kinase [Nocardioides potassii]MCF6376334.1 histidine kinase [Nocardioides potassii]
MTSTTHQSRRDVVLDVVLALVVLVASALGAPPNSPSTAPSWPDANPAVLGPIVLASLLLLLRRRYPQAVWAGTVVLALVPAVTIGESGRGLPAVAVALYTVAAYAGRRWALWAGVVSVVMAMTIFLTTADSVLSDPALVAVLPWCGLAAALGDTVRSHRLRLADARERARVAEETREEEARRRVAEERLRLSRELHDVIGHHLAVINVQAGLAEVLTTRDPDGAIAALEQVRAATSEALSQTSALVGHLRIGDDDTGPAPTLRDLPGIVESTRAAGAEVRWTRRGDLPVADAVVDRNGVRIVQEALTNAVRHGAGPVQLLTDARDGRLRIEVTNRLRPGLPPARPETDGGHGLVGMRERVILCGGTLEAGAEGEAFRVLVELPLDPRGDAPATVEEPA